MTRRKIVLDKLGRYFLYEVKPWASPDGSVKCDRGFTSPPLKSYVEAYNWRGEMT